MWFFAQEMSREHGARRELLVVDAQPLHRRLDQRLLVALVVDDEILRVPDGRLAGYAEGIRSASMSRRSTRTQNEWNVEITGLAIESPPTSLSTRSTISAAALLVKVTARMDSGITPMILDQMGDAVGDDARLAAARAGQDQHRPVSGFDGFALLRIELIEERQNGSGSEVH